MCAQVIAQNPTVITRQGWNPEGRELEQPMGCSGAGAPQSYKNNPEAIENAA